MYMDVYVYIYIYIYNHRAPHPARTAARRVAADCDATSLDI